jgi:hypothetical protein
VDMDEGTRLTKRFLSNDNTCSRINDPISEGTDPVI